MSSMRPCCCTVSGKFIDEFKMACAPEHKQALKNMMVRSWAVVNTQPGQMQQSMTLPHVPCLKFDNQWDIPIVLYNTC